MLIITTAILVIQEAGLDGFWMHRALEKECESHVVDAASIAVSRRRRRAKTDRIDGEALLRRRGFAEFLVDEGPMAWI